MAIYHQIVAIETLKNPICFPSEADVILSFDQSVGAGPEDFGAQEIRYGAKA